MLLWVNPLIAPRSRRVLNFERRRFSLINLGGRPRGELRSWINLGGGTGGERDTLGMDQPGRGTQGAFHCFGWTSPTIVAHSIYFVLIYPVDVFWAFFLNTSANSRGWYS